MSAMPLRIRTLRNRRRRGFHLGASGSATLSTEKVRVCEEDTVQMGSLRVARLGIGTIAWSAETEEQQATLRDLSAVAVDEAMIFDTAERYGTEFGPPFDRWPFGRPGRCEEILGETLGGQRGIVATKFTPTPWRMSAEDVVSACKASARRLGRESVDLYQIHHPDIVQPLRKFGLARPRDDELWEGLADCVELGLARNVGVCNYGPTLLGRAQEALERRGVKLATNQINFSLLYRRQGVMPTIEFCKQNGIGVLAYWPLCMGLLTGATQFAAFSKQEQGLQQYLKGGGWMPVGGIQPLLAVTRKIAEETGKTLSQVALNWIICKGAVPIPGARTPARLREYLGALGWRLSPEQVKELEEAAEALPFDFEGAGYRFSSAKFVGYGTERWYLN